MKTSEYLERAFDAYNSGKIDAEVYDAIVENAEIFCEDCEDSRLPSYYAEIEYDDFDNPEAIEGAKFDDMNYRHYMER